MQASDALWIYLVIGSCLTFQFTQWLVDLDGPFNIFARLRRLTGIHWDEWSRKVIPDNPLAKLLSCHKCTSVWIGWLVALLLRPSNFPLALENILTYGLAFSTISIMIYSWVRYLEAGS